MAAATEPGGGKSTFGGAEIYSFAYSGAGNEVASDGMASYSRNVDGSLVGVKTAVSSVQAWTDIHDDVVAQFTDSGAALSGSTTYTPFGKVASTSGMLGNLGYQSGFTDPQTDKVNMAARWYSPGTGQFSSRDTVSNDPLPASVNANQYAYANQNPMTGVDPTGHWFDFIKKAVKKVTKKVKKGGVDYAHVVLGDVLAVMDQDGEALCCYLEAPSPAMTGRCSRCLLVPGGSDL